MTFPTRLFASVIVLAALAGCAHNLPGASTPAATRIAAQASQAGRDKACVAFLAEYGNLSWDYSKEKKQALLQMIANTGSAKAVAPLTAEYNNLSWDYSKEKKQLLMETLGRLSEVAAQPCAPGFSADVQNQICKTFLTEYSNLSWDYSKDRKVMLLETIAKTGSDLAVDALTAEYGNLSWDYSKEKKQLLLATLAKLLAVAPPCNQTEALEAEGSVARRKKPSRQHVAVVLKADIEKAPASERKIIEKLLAIL